MAILKANTCNPVFITFEKYFIKDSSSMTSESGLDLPSKLKEGFTPLSSKLKGVSSKVVHTLLMVGALLG